MKDTIFTGWKQVIRTVHYFRNGTSLCTRAILFRNTPKLEGGKNCAKCLKMVWEQKRKAA